MFHHKTASFYIALSALLVAGSHLRADSETDATSPLNSVEFRGVLELKDSQQFSLRNTASQSSFWLQMGRTTNGFTPVAFDKDSGRLTVKHSGREYHLKLVESSDTPLDVVKSEPVSETSAQSKEYTIPPAPTFTPPAPPNGGQPPSKPAPANSPPSLPPSLPKLPISDGNT